MSPPEKEGRRACAVTDIAVEIYRVFSLDSDTTHTANVPTRTNSPSDVAFERRDSSQLSFRTTSLGSLTAQNSVLNGSNPTPNQTTGGEGPVTGSETLFDVNFSVPLVLAPGHYFFVPQVLLSDGQFYWLSSVRPIVPPGTPFAPDLQRGNRNANNQPSVPRLMRSISAIALAAAAALAMAASPAPQTPTSTNFFEDFAGPSLDRSVWNVIVTGRTVNNEQQAYVDSPETISLVSGPDAEGASNGALAIHARYRPGFKTPEGRAFDFTSGRLDTRDKMTFTYGTAAARIKLTAGQGLWPAFWALGAGPWPATGEIDIMENVGESDWTNVAMHGPGYSGNTPFSSRHHFPPSNDITGWHIYSLDWAPDRLVFKVDGEQFYEVTKEMVEKYGRWAFDNPKHLIVNLAIGGQYPRSVNHADTPYAGVPAPTVDLIKADKAVMLVDWIRITGR